MEDSRRRFLKLAGVSALGLTTRPVLNAFCLLYTSDAADDLYTV